MNTSHETLLSARGIRSIGLALSIALVSILGLIASVWSAPTVANYDYVLPVTITSASTASDQTNFPVRINMNAIGLSGSGYINADGQDLLALVSGTERAPFVEMGIADASWWVPLATLTTGQTASASLYMGQNTTNADNPQTLFLQSSIESATAASDAQLGQMTSNLTFELVGVSFTSFPATPTNVFSKGTYAALRIDAGGIPSFKVTHTGSGCAGSTTVTASTATLDAGTAYSLRGTFFRAATPQTLTRLYLNDVLIAETNDLAHNCSLTFNSNNVVLTPPGSGAMTVEQARIGAVSTSTPLWQLDWQFEPDELTQTQEGTSGNSWNWLGTIADQSAYTHTGNYTFVRDTSGYTVSLGPIASLTTYASTPGSEVFPTFLAAGEATSPLTDPFNVSGATYSWPLNIFDNFVGDSSKYQMPDLMFSSLVGFLVAFFAFIGTFAATRIIGLATITGLVFFAAIVLATPLPGIILIVCAVAGVLVLRIIPEPFTAR